jgi:hypothetical protein
MLAAITLATMTMAGGRAQAAESAKKQARPHYEKGAAEYNLGHFPESVAEFEKAYELDPAPILLFNIAQAHRQNGNNERASFFYRRYLEQAPNAANRAEVEKRMKELEGVIQQQNDLKRRPPTEVTDQEHDATGATAVAGNAAPGRPPGTVVETASPTAYPPGAVAAPAGGVSSASEGPSGPPGRIRVWASAGPAFPSFSGRGDLQEPTLLSVRLGGGYVFDLGRAGAIDVGASAAYAPIQYRRLDNDANQNAGFWGLMATGTYHRRVAKMLELSGELGLGAVWWSGIGEQNPFTAAGAAATGPVPMPSLLIGVGAIYHLPRRFMVFVEPTFLFSKTTGDGLTSTVSSVTRFDLALGVGYRI